MRKQIGLVRYKKVKKRILWLESDKFDYFTIHFNFDWIPDEVTDEMLTQFFNRIGYERPALQIFKSQWGIKKKVKLVLFSVDQVSKMINHLKSSNWILFDIDDRKVEDFYNLQLVDKL